jgi:hypothetical protein
VTQPTVERGSRGFRPVGWALGAVLFLVLLAIGAVIWFFGFAWPHSGSKADRDAGDQTSAVAQTIARGLSDRAADGKLTRAEIDDVVGHLPASVLSVQLDGTPLAVVAKVHGVAGGPAGSVGSTRCYQFTMSYPIQPDRHVDAVPLASCPPEPGPSS